MSRPNHQFGGRRLRRAVLAVVLVGATAMADVPGAGAVDLLPIPAACFGHSVGPGGTYQTPDQHRQASLYLLNTYNCRPTTSDASNNFIARSTASVHYPSGSQYADSITFSQTARTAILRNGCVVDANDSSVCNGDNVFTNTVSVTTVLDWPATLTATTLSPKAADGNRYAVIQQPGGAWFYDNTLNVTLTRSGSCGMETRYLGGIPNLSCTYSIAWAGAKPTVDTLVAFTFLAHVGISGVDATHWLIACDVTGTLCGDPQQDLYGVGEAASVARLVQPPPTNPLVASFTATPIATTPGQYQFVSTTTNPAGGLLTETWSIDGTVVGQGSNITYTFTKPGTYRVALQSSNQFGETDSTFQDIVVAAPKLETGVVVKSATSVVPGDVVDVDVVVSAGPGVGDLTNVHFDTGFTSGLAVSPTNGGAVTSGPTPALPTTLHPGDQAILKMQVTAGDPVGITTLSTGVAAVDAAGQAVSHSSQANIKVSEHALQVTVTPSSSQVILEATGVDPPTPQTVDVDVAVENVSDTAVDSVTIGSLTISPVSDAAVVQPPNGDSAIGTLDAHQKQTVTRHVTVSGDGVFTLSAVVSSAVEGATGQATLKVGTKGWLGVEPAFDKLAMGRQGTVAVAVTNSTGADLHDVSLQLAVQSVNGGDASLGTGPTVPTTIGPAGDVFTWNATLQHSGTLRFVATLTATTSTGVPIVRSGWSEITVKTPTAVLQTKAGDPVAPGDAKADVEYNLVLDDWNPAANIDLAWAGTAVKSIAPSTAGFAVFPFAIQKFPDRTSCSGTLTSSQGDIAVPAVMQGNARERILAGTRGIQYLDGSTAEEGVRCQGELLRPAAEDYLLMTASPSADVITGERESANPDGSHSAAQFVGVWVAAPGVQIPGLATNLLQIEVPRAGGGTPSVESYGFQFTSTIAPIAPSADVQSLGSCMGSTTLSGQATNSQSAVLDTSFTQPVSAAGAHVYSQRDLSFRGGLFGGAGNNEMSAARTVHLYGNVVLQPQAGSLVPAITAPTVAIHRFAQTAACSTSPTAAGAIEVPVASNTGFSLGDIVAVDPGQANEDTGTVIGFGSLILDTPLAHAHDAGATVVVTGHRELGLAVSVSSGSVNSPSSGRRSFHLEGVVTRAGGAPVACASSASVAVGPYQVALAAVPSLDPDLCRYAAPRSGKGAPTSLEHRVSTGAWKVTGSDLPSSVDLSAPVDVVLGIGSVSGGSSVTFVRVGKGWRVAPPAVTRYGLA